MKLINTIKMLLYQRGIYYPKNTLTKINILLMYKINIEKIKEITITVATAGIMDYKRELDDILSFNNFKEFNRNVKLITPHTYKTMTIDSWYSDNGRLIDLDIKYLIEWLQTAKKIQALYDILSSNITDNTPYNNSVKIKPYIINTESIVTDILLNLKD